MVKMTKIQAIYKIDGALDNRHKMGKIRKRFYLTATAIAVLPASKGISKMVSAIEACGAIRCCGSVLEQPHSAGHYRSIVIDPPWDQGKTGKRAVRPNQGRDLDYATMSYDEIAAVEVSEWAADDAFLWLWATNSRSRSSGRPILQQAFDLMEKWGFRYYTMLTWDKGTGPCPFGPYQITTEHCLFGYRGKCVFPKDSMGQMKTLFSAPSKRHSEKPAVLYEYITHYFPSPRLDVFARKRHRGFDAWGNEVSLI